MDSARIGHAPKVSIIMPCYMTAHLVAGAIGSVLKQSFQEFEIVLVNDGSPDSEELESALAPWREKIVYIKQENKRAAGARNTAIRYAKGEFLAFLDSDDTWMPEHLASQMSLFERTPMLDLVYSDGWMDTPKGSRKFTEFCPSRGEATFEALVVERCQIPVSTVVARKPALAKAGCFDETLHRCDDYDMWLRSAFWGAKIGYSQMANARFSGKRPGSLGASSLQMTEAYWTILEKAMQTLPLSEGQKDLVQHRSGAIQARYLLQQGKVHLYEGRLAEAMKLFSESNDQAPKSKLNLLLWGLKFAPGATMKLVSLAKRNR
jgi:glycosyltransferase involved in cell wall biosynthesis